MRGARASISKTKSHPERSEGPSLSLRRRGPRGPLAALRGDRELKRSGFATLFLRSEARAPLCHFVAQIRGAPSLRFGVTAN
jgi:hypothetical protein